MTAARSTKRRVAVCIALIVAVLSVFVVRLVDIQVVRASELTTAALNKRATAITTYAARGTIVDNHGVVLAGSVLRYDITVSPRTLSKLKTFVRGQGSQKALVTLEQAATELAAVTGQTPHDVLTAFTAKPNSDFEYVAKSVSTDQMRLIRNLHIPAIYPRSHPTRIYPDGAVAGNLLGFVGTDGPQNGLEFTENKCLASVDGSSTYERGANGVQLPGSAVTTRAAVAGGTVMTTIDHDLQWSVGQMIAEQALAIGAESATASVTEVKTGKVLALADWPAVDPNNVDATPAKSLGSLAFTAAYEPGSTFKPMTAAILLDKKAATPLSQVVVPYRWVSKEGSVVRDATPHPVQQLTLAGVLQQSSNVGISQLAINVPSKERYTYMRAFGVGEPTAIDFQGESAGLLAKTWDDQTKYDVSFGQGVSVTAAQMAGIYQTIGNGGLKLPLTLVTGCKHSDGTITDVPTTVGKQIVSESAAKTVVQMMEGVVTGGGLSSLLTIPGYRVAAKSGTAEVALNGVYTADRIVSLAGLAPAEDPQYAVIVTFTKPSTIKTSAAAAPTFKKIMMQVLKTYRVTPSTTPSPNLPTTW
ncbi:MAG: penicillin-binding protein 2 [Microbacteriaceae bacterium]|nr:penicillin-binding protein 2 [Microbacteriaceae bacterium]